MVENVFLNQVLKEWAEDKPWHYTPPLLIQTTEDADVDDVAASIGEEFNLHDFSEVETMGLGIISGVMISCEDLKALAQRDDIKMVEIEGYGKAIDGDEITGPF